MRLFKPGPIFELVGTMCRLDFELYMLPAGDMVTAWWGDEMDWC